MPVAAEWGGGRGWVSPFAVECPDVEGAGAGSGERGGNCRRKVPEKVQGMGSWAEVRGCVQSRSTCAEGQQSDRAETGSLESLRNPTGLLQSSPRIIGGGGGGGGDWWSLAWRRVASV